MKQKDRNLLPFYVIVAASSGEVEAMNVVLKHYEGYILALSTREYRDKYGQRYVYVDETLRQRLERKLMIKTLGFRFV